MAGTGAPVKPQLIAASAATEASRHSRSGPVFSVPLSSGSSSGFVLDPLVAQGPSCLFVGPIESASKETLEALYRQARESYYNGSPLIVDDMFDRVELKLRRFGSKCVVKYPRCSLRKQSTYADAEVSRSLLLAALVLCLWNVIVGGIKRQEDPSQVFALASIWILILAFGGSVCLVPMIVAIGQAYHDAIHNGATYASQTSILKFLTLLNGIVYVVLGSVIGYPVASSSVAALQGIWKNDLVALKGVCPNCGEEVFAFVRSDQSNKSPHRSQCHVCESFLEFRTRVERSITGPSRQWVYGRIYLIR